MVKKSVMKGGGKAKSGRKENRNGVYENVDRTTERSGFRTNGKGD